MVAQLNILKPTELYTELYELYDMYELYVWYKVAFMLWLQSYNKSEKSLTGIYKGINNCIMVVGLRITAFFSKFLTL